MTRLIGKDGHAATALIEKMGAVVTAVRHEIGYEAHGEITWTLDVVCPAECRLSADGLRRRLELEEVYVDSVREDVQVSFTADVHPGGFGLTTVRRGTVDRTMVVMLRQWELGR